MLKRLGTFALLLAACGAAIAPRTALAQDGYYDGRGYGYYHNDRDWDRHARHEWRERERREERRAEEWRERQWHERWRYNHSWRDRYPAYGYQGNYPPPVDYGYSPN